MSTTIARELPVIAPGTQAYTCSVSCGGRCCKYFSLPIDTPTDDAALDDIRWYLMHEDTHVYKYEGDWYLLIQRRCRHLQANNLCGIYDRRPRTCADYDPSDCEFTGEPDYELYFRDDAELDTWLAKRKAKRSRAARAGWAKRRKGRGHS